MIAFVSFYQPCYSLICGLSVPQDRSKALEHGFMQAFKFLSFASWAETSGVFLKASSTFQFFMAGCILQLSTPVIVCNPPASTLLLLDCSFMLNNHVLTCGLHSNHLFGPRVQTRQPLKHKCHIHSKYQTFVTTLVQEIMTYFGGRKKKKKQVRLHNTGMYTFKASVIHVSSFYITIECGFKRKCVTS